MTYAEILEYLYTRLPMFSRSGQQAITKDLTNTIELCRRLDDPHTKFKTIHVGGTNGKGSVSHMLAAVLQQAGYKTGLYTSPHLYDFRERIRINGDMISEEKVIAFVNKIQPAIDDINPSFFEISVAMAFDHFAEERVDVAIIEVGLGGRLDSTNVILPDLAIITNIGLDHMQLLGNSLKDIASEKAGIIKNHLTVVIGEKNADTMPVFDHTAIERDAAVFYAEDHYIVQDISLRPDGISMEIWDEKQNRIIHAETDLAGIYQARNLPVVLTALYILKQNGWNVDPSKIAALKHVKQTTGLRGRWEVLQRDPLLVLDVAHNEDGIKQMLHHLQQIRHDRLHMVFGMVKDKAVNEILSLLPKNAQYYFSQAHIPRALDASSLMEEAKKEGLKGLSYDDVNEALKAALKSARANDVIIVCGSIFLVAEVDREQF